MEYRVPLLRPDFPTGYRVIWLDRDQNIWLALAAQGAIAKFDRNTEKFQVWKIPNVEASPRGATMVQPWNMNVDGKLWVLLNGSKIQRLDVKTGEWEREPISVFQHIDKDSPEASRKHGTYDVISDSHNDAYFTDFSSELIGKIDAKTKKVVFWQTPTFNSGPRRAHVDDQDRLWFGEDRGWKIGMFDPKTQRIQEWANPTPFNTAYDVVLDKNGYAWTGGMVADRVSRLNTKTGEIIEYLLPRYTNIRKVEIDNSTNPVTFWVGNNNGASILKLEPLD
jgi:virginiamycin B lyase